MPIRHRRSEKYHIHLLSMMQEFSLKKMTSLESKLRKKMKSASSARSVESIRASESILTFVSFGRLLPVCKQVLSGLLVYQLVIFGDTSRLVSFGLASFTLYGYKCSFKRYLLTFFRYSLQVRRPCLSEFERVVVRLVVIVSAIISPFYCYSATFVIRDRLRRVCRESIRRLSIIPLLAGFP